ncbi:MAG: glycosyltransferase [Oribacterium sp.]
MTREIMVSVLLVTYNHGRYIGECLEHILGQKRDFGIEILLHDDASTDGAQEIIRDYQRRYPELVKPILRTENQYSRGKTNITGLFNLPRAVGKYVATLDGDDYWCDPYKLKKQISYMEAHPDTALCFHAARVLREDGGPVNTALMTPFPRSRELDPRELVDHASGAAFGSFLLRREILLPLPAFYFTCPVGDRPLELIAAAHGKAYYFREPMSVYRFHTAGSWSSGQFSGDYAEKQRRYAAQMAETYREFDRETGGRFHRETENAAARLRFLTELNLRNYPEIYAERNRGYYRELCLRDRVFLRFEQRLPALYRLLQARTREKQEKA